MATSPAPASSNGACGFPALRFPDDFTPRGYGTSRSGSAFGTEGQSLLHLVRPRSAFARAYIPSLRSCRSRAPLSSRPCLPLTVEECHQQGRFAPRTLLRFVATTSPSATLSSSADFPGSPVIRPTWLRRFRGGTRRASPVARRVLVTVLSLPPRRRSPAASASLRRALLPSPSGCGLGLRGFALSGPPLRSLSLRPGDSLTHPEDGLVDGLQDIRFPSCLPSKLRGFWLLPRRD